jgi:protein gp37
MAAYFTDCIPGQYVRRLRARVSAEFLGRIFATMALTPQHTYRVLTKRPNRMRDLLTDRRVQGAMQDALLDIQSRTP